MGLGGIVNSVVNRAREVVHRAENTFRNTTGAAERHLPTIRQFDDAARNMTSRRLGNDPVSDITRTAFRTAKNQVAPLTNPVSGGVLDDIGDFGRGLLDRGRRFVGGARNFAENGLNRAIDAGRTFVNSKVESIIGFGRSVVEGVGQTLSGFGQILNPAPLDKLFRGDFSGAWNDFKNNFDNGIKDVAGGFVKSTVQAVVDSFVVELNGTISAVQTLVGLEPPSRALNEREISELRKVYGDSIDYSQIRLKEGHLGIANGLAPHTVGNTIYIPEGWIKSDDPNRAANRNKLLVHESAHIWQYQNGGTDYIGESLWNQAAGAISGGSRDAAYEFDQPVKDGKSWAELNPEQQAHLLDQAYKAGIFDDPNARFLLDDGTDITDYARNAVNEVRNGRGAP